MSADGSGRAAGSQAPATPREKTAECWAADGRAARTPAGAYPIGEHRIEQLPQPRASARTAPRCTDARLERSLSAESRTAIATHGTGNCGPLRILRSQRERMVHARQGVRNAPIASCPQSTDSTTFGRPGYLRRAMESGVVGFWSEMPRPACAAKTPRLRRSAPAPPRKHTLW